jgi:hypothetical protein
MTRSIPVLIRLTSLRLTLGETAPGKPLKPSVKAQERLEKGDMPCLFPNFQFHLG